MKNPEIKIKKLSERIKKGDVKYLADNNLLNNEEKEKWLKLTR
jgi:hypothetical protein